MAIVLVVDDDPGVLEVVEMALTPHHVIAVDSGAGALAMLEEKRVDAVVLDVTMPELNGIETLRRIRSDGKHHELPVVLLTAKVKEDDHLRGYQAGADAYVTKPFDPDDLAETLGSVLRRTPDERREVRERERERAALLRQVERRFR